MVASILIVEDDISIRDILTEILEEEAYQVFASGSGEEACDLLQAAKPDLFLLDCMLPGMDGIQLIAHIRSLEKFHYTPIVLMSAYHFCPDHPEDVKFLHKPFSLDDLLVLIEEGLARVNAA